MNESAKVYQRLTLIRKPISIADLSKLTGIAEADLFIAIEDLIDRGLTKVDNHNLVIPVPWWDETHLEVFINIPRVERDVFNMYCSELDQLALEMRVDGFVALRPYSHETTIEIILEVAASFVLVEFAKAFLGEIGKKFAEFVGRIIEKYHSKGIIEVEITGTIRFKDHTECTFSVKGTDAKQVIEYFKEIEGSIERSNPELEKQNKILLNGHLKGDDWKLILKKRN